jgi:hypothetical protein
MMKRTGLWAFDSRCALGIWGALLLGTAVYVATAFQDYEAQPARPDHEDCPLCYVKWVEPVGIQAFDLGHVWLIGICLHVGKRLATYRRARVVLLVGGLLLLLVAGHWIRVQSEKKGLVMGRGDRAAPATIAQHMRPQAALRV